MKNGVQHRIGARLARTLVPALLGASLGYAYCRTLLPYEIPAESTLPAIYAAGGAAISLLGFRLVSLARLIWREFSR